MRDFITPGESVAVLTASLERNSIVEILLQLCNGMAERGLAVELVVCTSPVPLPEMLSNRIRVVFLGVGNPLLTLWRLTKYLRRHPPKALLTARVRQNLAAIAARLLSGVKTRLVISEHPDCACHARWIKSQYRLLYTAAVRYVYPLADAVVTVSQDAAKSTRGFAPLLTHKVVWIYNPVMNDALFRQSLAPIQHPWFHDPEYPLILAVGRLVVQKNYPLLLRAFALLRHTRPCRLMILGEGNERKSLESMTTSLGIEKDVALPGNVDNASAYMRHADLLALSSRCEGLPTVLIEALACGCPIVSTNCPSGPREILADGRFGTLVPCGDSETLAKAMVGALANRPEINKEELQQHLQKFSLREALPQYIDILINS
ncbi:MAG: glycosyltransferase [Pseudomonadota bacterium]|nr:glycosyltransferase [Pseudomonadota bacterium]